MVSGEEEVLSRHAPPPDDTRPYAAGPAQVYDVRFPSFRPPETTPSAHSTVLGASATSRSNAREVQDVPQGTVLVVHGGFWRAEYDRAHAGPQAAGLAGAGWHVAVGEYRRAGMPGGGWPGTLEDIAALVAAVAADPDLPGPLVLVGHSAGGHLVAWAANQPWAPGLVAGVVVLAGCVDLGRADRLHLGGDAARAFLGDPRAEPDAWRQADPMTSLPPAVPVRLVHGAHDEEVPLEAVQDYLARVRALGGDVTLDVVRGTGHYGLVDPDHSAFQRVLAALETFGASQ